MNYRLGILIDENNASNNKSVCVDTRFKSSKFVTYFNTDILFFYNKTYKSLYIAKRFGNSSDYKVIKSVEIYSNPEDVNKDVYYMEFCQNRHRRKRHYFWQFCTRNLPTHQKNPS